MIKHRNGKYILYTKDGSRVLGTHSSYHDAMAQETAINISKAKAAGHKIVRSTKKEKKRIKK